jgi:predicted Fe-Mo cluster-binding NifX family protein
MRIAVFEREGRVLLQCKEIAQVALVDIDPVTHSVRQTAFLTPPLQTLGALAEWLRGQKVEVVLTSGIGRRDRELLEQKGIQVIVGVPPFRVEPVIANFLSGTLRTGANPCEQPTGGRE